jgi:hypothetical protein
MKTKSVSLQFWIPAFVGLAAACVVMPILGNGFVLGDDNIVVVQNPHIRGFSAENVQWMFSNFRTGKWLPLGWIAYAAVHSVFGMKAAGFHLVQTGLHIAGVVLFYFAALRIFALAQGADGASDRQRLAAAFSALFYGLHPLRVETAAWCACMYYSLACVFFLLSILAYLRYAERQQARCGLLATSVLLCLASSMSMPLALTMPFLLLVLDFFPLRRFVRGGGGAPRLLAEKVPFLIVSIAIGAVTVIGARERMNSGVIDNPPFGQARSAWANASYGIASPVIVAFAPGNLSPCNVTPESFDPFNAGFTATLIASVALGAASIVLIRGLPALGAAVAGYFLLAAPFLGAGSEPAADRYTILSSMPLALLLGGIVLAIQKRRPRLGGIAMALAALWIGALGFLSWKQTAIWKDSIVFCRQMLKTDPDSPLLNNSMGQLLCAEGEWNEAARHFRLALQQADTAETRNNLGMALVSAGDRQGAIAQFQNALKISPDNQAARANLLKMGAADGANSNGD